MLPPDITKVFPVVLPAPAITAFSSHIMSPALVLELLTNGFFNVDETKIYHVGYYLMYVSFFVITLLYISILLKRDET